MKLRHLLFQVTILVLLLVLVNVVVQRLSANSVARQLLRKCEQVDSVTDVFLGNSTMAAGLDEAMFGAARPGRGALNAALGSSSPVEHYVIFCKLPDHKAARVYYGFFDTQLTDPPDGDWATLVGNRAMTYYVDRELAFRFYASDDPLKALRLSLVSRVPMLVERYAIWAKVERLRRVLDEVGLPKKETDRFGRKEDFALLESEDEGQFAKRCGQAAACSVPLTAPVAALLRRGTTEGVRVYVVEMPMPTSHRARFYSSPSWAIYRAHLIALVREAGSVYVPAAEWIGDDGFADPLHLNPAGAKAFSSRLAQWAADPAS